MDGVFEGIAPGASSPTNLPQNRLEYSRTLSYAALEEHITHGLYGYSLSIPNKEDPKLTKW
jgi:hypothetical protein